MIEQQQTEASAPAPVAPDFVKIAERLQHRASLQSAIDTTVRINTNEALALLLMASHPHRAGCAAIDRAWRHAALNLEQPYRREIQRWTSEHDHLQRG